MMSIRQFTLSLVTSSIKALDVKDTETTCFLPDVSRNSLSTLLGTVYLCNCTGTQLTLFKVILVKDRIVNSYSTTFFILFNIFININIVLL